MVETIENGQFQLYRAEGVMFHGVETSRLSHVSQRDFLAAGVTCGATRHRRVCRSYQIEAPVVDVQEFLVLVKSKGLPNAEIT